MRRTRDMKRSDRRHARQKDSFLYNAFILLLLIGAIFIIYQGYLVPRSEQSTDDSPTTESITNIESTTDPKPITEADELESTTDVESTTDIESATDTEAPINNIPSDKSLATNPDAPTNIEANEIAGAVATTTGTRARIIEVVDGDTIIFVPEHLPKEKITARLIGINTPEIRTPYTYEQCFGPEASAKMKELAASDPEIYVYRDIETFDKYDRYLLYVYRVRDHKSLNELMLEEGYARVLSIPPNDTFRTQFKQAEIRARSKNLGLWEACSNYD